MISSNTHCQLQCTPWLGPCPLPTRLVDTIVSAAKLAGNLVAHRWSLFQIVLEKQHELSAARKTWRASLSGDSLALFWQLGFSPFFNVCWMKLVMKTNICCTTSPAFLSLVLRLFLAYCHPNLYTQTVSLSEFWSKVPQRNVEVFNRVGPTGDSELDRRASDKTHEEFALGLMDGPYNSLEECAGNLAGKVEMFATLTIAPKTGSMKHLSPRRHTSLPVLTTTFLLSNCGKPPFLVSRYTGLSQTCGNISGKLALV